MARKLTYYSRIIHWEAKMKQIIYACLFFLLSNYLIAQNKIDSLIQIDKSIDTTKAHLIYDYRLPDWGYNMFFINFAGSGYDIERILNSQSRTNVNYDLNLSPHYLIYNESEKINTSLMVQISSGYSFSSYEDNIDNLDQVEERKNISNSISLNGATNNYFDNNIYYTFNTQQFFQYSESNYDFKMNGNKSETTTISRWYRSTNHIGIGYGRVRNITPVFRALRFNERIKNLFKIDLNSEEIEKIAELFTRNDGYENVYDRPDKYFYNDLPEEVKSKLSMLKPWEIFYLDEARREIIGTRLEGFQIDGGLSVNYDKRNYHPYSNNEFFLVGFYLDQVYYHNVSFRYQIGLNLSTSYLKAVNDNTPFKYVGNGIISFLNLFNLTDRLLMNWDFGYESGFLSADKNDRYNKWERLDDFYSNLSFRYYLENNLSLHLFANYGITTSWPEDVGFNFANNYYYASYDKQKRLSFSVGLRYYIDRGIY